MIEATENSEEFTSPPPIFKLLSNCSMPDESLNNIRNGFKNKIPLPEKRI